MGDFESQCCALFLLGTYCFEKFWRLIQYFGVLRVPGVMQRLFAPERRLRDCIKQSRMLS